MKFRKKCPGCGSVFTSKDDYFGHLVMNYADIKWFGGKGCVK